MPKILNHMRAVLAAAGAATIAFHLLIGPSMAIWAASMGRPVNLPDILFLAGLSLVLSPAVAVAFLLGTAAIGPLSYLGLMRLGLNTNLAAMLVAATTSGLAAYLLFGSGVPGGNVEVVAPLAIAGGLAGAIYRRVAQSAVKPPPAQPV